MNEIVLDSVFILIPFCYFSKKNIKNVVSPTVLLYKTHCNLYMYVCGKNVPSKMCKNKYNLPWVNKKLKQSLKTKARFHRQAKESGKWDRYRSFQRECKKQFRHVELNHINSVIQEGLHNNNSKSFWKYVKCKKKKKNICVSPLKQKRNLISDSKGKADILVEQFQLVFTKVKDTILPDLSN